MWHPSTGPRLGMDGMGRDEHGRWEGMRRGGWVGMGGDGEGRRVEMYTTIQNVQVTLLQLKLKTINIYRNNTNCF